MFHRLITKFQTTNLMKTKIFIAIITFFLNITVMFASEPIVTVKSEKNKMIITIEYPSVLPATLKEEVNLSLLAPSAPKETDFQDDTTARKENIALLAPVTPKEADFSDN